MSDIESGEDKGASQAYRPTPAARRLFVQAQRSAEAGDVDAARTCYEQTLAADPQFQAAWLGLASLTDDAALGRALYERILQKWPQCSAAALALADLEATDGGFPSEGNHRDLGSVPFLDGPARAGAPIYRGPDHHTVKREPADEVRATALAAADTNSESVRLPERRTPTIAPALRGALPSLERRMVLLSKEWRSSFGVALAILLLLATATGVLLMSRSHIGGTAHQGREPSPEEVQRFSADAVTVASVSDGSDTTAEDQPAILWSAVARRYTPLVPSARWLEIDTARGQMLAYEARVPVRTIPIETPSVDRLLASGCPDGATANRGARLLLGGAPVRFVGTQPTHEEDSSFCHLLTIDRVEAVWLHDWLGDPVVFADLLVVPPERIIIQVD